MPWRDKDYVMGHEVYHAKGENTWRFTDNKEIVGPGCKRECPKCKMMCEFNKPDPCLGMLPGIQFACCGHGVHEAYFAFANGKTIYFEVSQMLIRDVGNK